MVAAALRQAFLRLSLRGTDMQSDDLASTVAVRRHGDYCRDRDDAAALALLQIGRVEPQIRPLAGERAVEERMDALVDLRQWNTWASVFRRVSAPRPRLAE
jgi:hypothetical protein